MCVCVCVCDVTKMAMRRPQGHWRREQFWGEVAHFHAEVAHFLQMEGAVRVRGTRRASDTVSHWRQVPLLSWVRPQYHDYGLRTSLAKEVKGQMSIVTVYQMFRPNLGPSSLVDQRHMAW